MLSGRAREPGFAHEAARLLDLPVSADFLLVAALDLDERRADERLAPHGTAWARRTGGVVGLVALREADPAEPLAALADVAARQRVPLGVSPAVSGLAGVDDGFRLATLALRAQGSTPGVASLDARLPEALAAQLADGRRASPRTLGPPPAGAAGGRVETAAGDPQRVGRDRRLGHPHRGRRAVPPQHGRQPVRRVSELTGTGLLDQAPPVELDLALRAWRTGITGQTPARRV